MKYSSVNGERQEAQPNLSGRCQYCDSPTTAKCGDMRIWHWAHRGRCDPWKEGETEWHRAWKGQFPEEFQEVIQYAEDGEKHIADVKIDQGYVIEFQYSPIKSEERKAREDFYGNMVWIVSGTRRLKDKDAFKDVWTSATPLDGRMNLRRLQRPVGKNALLRDWGDSKMPVFFDFGEELLWGILPKTLGERLHICSIERDKLIACLHPAREENGFDALLKGWDNLIANEERYLLWLARGRPNLRSFRPW